MLNHCKCKLFHYGIARRLLLSFNVAFGKTDFISNRLNISDIPVQFFKQSLNCGPKQMENFQSRVNVTLVACGSFNPITFMHLRMFELAKDHLNNQHPSFHVTSGFISPVGDTYYKAELVSGKHRKKMCQLAVSSSNWIKAMSWELEQQEWTPTARVLDHYEEFVKKENELSKVMLVCGADLVESFSTKGLWLEKDLRNIIGHHGIVVVTRPCYDIDEIIERSELLKELRKNIFVVSEYFSNDVSSTKVRAALYEKKSVKYLVPDSVVDYITNQDLYSSPLPLVEKELAPFKKYRTGT